MGLSGFLLMSARSTWTRVEDDLDYFLHSGKFSESFDASLDLKDTMPCSQTGNQFIVICVCFKLIV